MGDDGGTNTAPSWILKRRELHDPQGPCSPASGARRRRQPTQGRTSRANAGALGRRPFPFLARWPADKAVRHARERIRELTDRSRLLLPTEVVVQDLNLFLTGWAAYFKYGNSAHRFGVIREYVRMRMALFISKRHKRSRGFGRYVVSYASPDHLGLVSLSGNVVAPRPFRDWRGKPNAGGERRR
ncbi:group II intron maturase-specific domain-containing protein [Streptomyces sp. CA-106110]|uniref:group II intron maturase-specific domain-containing protein n=1 Tax=Streptomyces sp. CA-106110 TaxID=3240044 RepID=UPI003D8D961A